MPNESILQETLKRIMSQNESVVFTLLSLDMFRTLNEGWGYFTGGKVYKEASWAIQSFLTEKDTFFTIDHNKFAIITPTSLKTRQYHKLLKDMKNFFTHPITIDHEIFEVTASIGISSYPKDGIKASDIIESANIALQWARISESHVNAAFYTGTVRDHQKNYTKLKRDLHYAADRGELFLEYQPQVDMKNNNIVGVEALLRWKREDGKIIAPMLFIPLAESSGNITNLGDWVIKEVCLQATKWRNKGINLRLSINISPVQIYSDYYFFTKLQRELSNASIPTSIVDLEVTEKILQDHCGFLEKFIKQAQFMGMRVYLDDFGKGRSSIDFLRKFHFDGIKIDRSIITDIADSSRNKKFANSLIQLAGSIANYIVIEGVESNAQLEALHIDEGKTIIQGFLFSKPLRPEHIPSFISQYKKQPSFEGCQKLSNLTI